MSEPLFRVLIVEDEGAARRVLVATLMTTGFRNFPIDAPASWEEFLDLLTERPEEEAQEEEDERRQYNIVILDGKIWPPRTWAQAMAELRKADRLDSVPILIWISGDMDVPAQLREEFCLVLTLAKPFGPKDILRELSIIE